MQAALLTGYDGIKVAVCTVEWDTHDGTSLNVTEEVALVLIIKTQSYHILHQGICRQQKNEWNTLK